MEIDSVIVEINEALKTKPVLSNAIAIVSARHGKKSGTLDQQVRRHGYRLVTLTRSRLEKR